MKSNILQIEETKNYNQFTFLKSNRQVNLQHTAKLTSKILRNNLLYCNPIQVNEKLEVIDSQHRLLVARNNQLAIYYIVIPGLTIKDVRELNVGTNSWTAMTFLASFTSEGKEDYIWLSDFIMNNSLNLTMAILFLTASYDGGNRPLKKHIVNGTLSLSKSIRQRAVQRAKAWDQIRVYFTGTSNHRPARDFVYEFVKYIDAHGENIVQTIIDRDEQFEPEKTNERARAQIVRLAQGK